MIIMAENDSGVIFMSEAPKSHNGTITLDSAMTSDSDSEGMSTLAARSYLSAETKRNKRKNFQPRNIAYSETESITESFSNRDRTSSDSSESDYALDLSNADLIKTMHCTKQSPKREVKTEKCEEISKNDDELDEPMESSPMDLSCSKNTSPYPYNHVNSYYSDSDSDDMKQEERRRKEILESLKPSSTSYFLHPFLGHSGDASDLKEYAQNTVKELLEIYGLNNDAVTDVAQTITNNVPISNFSSGKYILREFLSMCVSFKYNYLVTKIES